MSVTLVPTRKTAYTFYCYFFAVFSQNRLSLRQAGSQSQIRNLKSPFRAASSLVTESPLPILHPQPPHYLLLFQHFILLPVLALTLAPSTSDASIPLDLQF